MMNWKLSASLATAASLALIAACAGTSGDAGKLAAPGTINRVLTSATAAGDPGDNTPNQGEVEICKYGTAAEFDVAPTGGSPTRYSLADGECKVVVVDKTQGNTANSYTIQEVSSSSYVLTSVQRTDIQFQVNTTTDIVGNPTVVNDPVVALVNYYHGVHLVYHNDPVVNNGCTYTQGWYKTHTSEWPSGAYAPGTTFDGWKSWIDLYNTVPKGNQYIILAHQYMTALLNIQGGASVPAAVQTALDTAEDYFTGGGVGTGDSSVDISGVATILDDYNNGLTGPGHCE
jgi:hypothetical protein